jgi:hypothetical protein
MNKFYEGDAGSIEMGKLWERLTKKTRVDDDPKFDWSPETRAIDWIYPNQGRREMLRVTLELVPFGIEENKETVSVLEIANDGTGNGELANYKARWLDLNEDWRDNVVCNFPRLDLDYWDLVLAVLRYLREETR